MTQSRILVRRARDDDIPELVKIERAAWTKVGTFSYTAEHFRTWRNINPQCFLVAAADDGALLGYVYAQMIDFSFKDIPRFRSCAEMTDGGFTRTTHDPWGDSLYGTSLVSVRRGAGKALNRAMFALVRKLKKRHYIGFSRISRFSEYLAEVQAANIFPAITPELETKIALWYTLECAKIVGGKVWPICPKQPELSLPALKVPDPVLRTHLACPGFGIVGVVPGYMPDPGARDHGIFCVYKTPLRK